MSVVHYCNLSRFRREVLSRDLETQRSTERPAATVLPTIISFHRRESPYRVYDSHIYRDRGEDRPW